MDHDVASAGPAPLSLDERRAILLEEIANQLALGDRRLESESGVSAVIVIGKPVNNLLHLLISIVTIGIWLIVWAILFNFAGEKRELIRVDQFGKVTIQRVK